MYSSSLIPYSGIFLLVHYFRYGEPQNKKLTYENIDSISYYDDNKTTKIRFGTMAT